MTFGADRSGRRDVAILCMLMLAALGLDLFFYHITLEDAFITFRYARHLAEGHGLGAWNTQGPRVEGYTSLLWLLLIGGGARLGLNPLTLSKVVGIGCHLASIAFLFSLPSLFRDGLPEGHVLMRCGGAVGQLAAALIALYLPFSWYASSGMESSAFAFLATVVVVTAGLRGRRARISLTTAAVLIVLTRPEGMLIALAANAYALLVAKRQGEGLTSALASAAATGVTIAALTTLRVVVFGNWLPNTYYAKVGGAGAMHLDYGVRYVRAYLRTHFAICIPIGVLAAWSLPARRRPGVSWLMFLMGLTLVYTAYVMRVGGDNPWAFPCWRHFVHICGLLAILLASAMVLFFERRAAVSLIGLALILVVTTRLMVSSRPWVRIDLRDTLSHLPRLHHDRPSPYYTWLADLTLSTNTLATALGGELPYVVDCQVIDMLGLNDRYIAHHGHFDPAGPIDSKTDMESVLRRRPDIIEGYVSAEEILRGLPRSELVRNRRHMVEAMLAQPAFRDEYLFLINGPYEYLDRALFLRRDFWQHHPRKSELRCIPVTATQLYGTEEEISSGTPRSQ